MVLISKLNRFIILFFLFLYFNISLNAQYGVNVSYNVMFPNESWDQMINEVGNSTGDQKLFPNNYGVSLDYWFRLNNYRIEFLPELSYNYITKEVVLRRSNLIDKNGHVTWQKIALHFNTNVYIFNIEGDCNCPTFGKQDPFIKKGLYLQITPGVDFLKGELTDNNLLISAKFSQIAPSLSLGIGIDIGISNYLTLSPWLRRGIIFNVLWEELSLVNEFTEPSKYSTNINSTNLGIRLGYRFDYKRRY